MLENLFGLKKAGTTARTEIMAGIATFLTMAYITVVNPAILSTEGSGMEFGAVFTATIIAAVVGTLIMGLWANWPIALAPGMGLNAFFTFGVIFGMGYTYAQALLPQPLFCWLALALSSWLCWTAAAFLVP